MAKKTDKTTTTTQAAPEATPVEAAAPKAEQPVFTMEGNNYLGSMSADIHTALVQARGASAESLVAFRAIGALLNGAKVYLAEQPNAPKGAFGEWCEKAGFGFDKSWRARLMKLSTFWPEIVKALEETPDAGRKAFSVDGCLAVYDAWRKKNDPDEIAKQEAKDKAAAEKAAKATSSASEGDGEGDGGEGGGVTAKAVEEALKLALVRIEELRKERDALQAKLDAATAKKAAKPQAEAMGSGPKVATPQPVSQKTKDTVKKLFALATRPGTPEEGEVAKGKIEEIAAKHGITLETLLDLSGC